MEYIDGESKGLCNECYCKMWRKNHPNYTIEKMRQWRKDNPKRYKKITKEWNDKNKDKIYNDIVYPILQYVRNYILDKFAILLIMFVLMFILNIIMLVFIILIFIKF